MADYGDAVLQRHADGRVTVERADDVIGISADLLAELRNGADPAAVGVTTDGHLALGSDRSAVYRPVRFVLEGHQHVVLVCERVTAGG